jgi:hypothetical protein
METPKEYAVKLFDKMYAVEDLMGNHPMSYETAKKCALIAVDEIIKEYDDVATFYRYGFNSEMIKARVDYLIEVKQEIQKL